MKEGGGERQTEKRKIGYKRVIGKRKRKVEEKEGEREKEQDTLLTCSEIAVK